MKAMIFSAGLGTRFKPWTEHHPKALAPINGRSLLQRNVEYLQRYGIYDVIVNVHHFADQIEEAVQQHNGWGSRIQLSDERREVLETGGGLLKAAPLFTPGEDFLTINVDILTTLDLNDFIAFHHQHNPLVSLAVSNRSSSRCFLFDTSMRLTGWKNLQTGAERIAIASPETRPYAFSGISLFSYRVFEHLKLEGKFSLVDAYLALAPSQPIMGFLHQNDNWVDVGKPESIPIAESMFR
ncbi:MAG: nucleotidyltransferase family protein [Sphingobacteriales bacterium]|jgi:NDP-sugar pyrophosphorylase family protein|nr:nucleotidyltransferase family protein [Sphingobacteriales bacterium]OJW31715.1 MAG: nucleotidyltransferase [Sphingobacteriales bacterium 46-32]